MKRWQKASRKSWELSSRRISFQGKTQACVRKVLERPRLYSLCKKRRTRETACFLGSLVAGVCNIFYPKSFLGGLLKPNRRGCVYICVYKRVYTCDAGLSKLFPIHQPVKYPFKRPIFCHRSHDAACCLAVCAELYCHMGRVCPLSTVNPCKRYLLRMLSGVPRRLFRQGHSRCLLLLINYR